MHQRSDGASDRSRSLRVGDLARLSGVGKATIEHYLRLDLLRPAGVGAQGYRLFDEEAVARIEVVRTGRRAGFGLGEIRAMLAVANPGELMELLTTLPPAQCRADLATRGASIDG